MSGSIKNGVFWSFASTSVGAAAQLSFIFILATFGSPEAVGLYSLLAAFQSIAFTLQDGGLLTYYVHRQKLVPAEQSALFWLTIIVGSVAALVLIGITPFVLWFYQSPILLGPMVLISAQIFVLAVASQCQAHLMKELRLAQLSKIEIAGKVLSVASFLLLMTSASDDGELLNAVFTAILLGSIVRGLGLLSACPFLPVQAIKTRPNWKSLAPALTYTGFHLGAQTVNQFRANLDVMILAKLVGAELTGIYSVSKEFVLKPSRIIQPVVARVVTPLLASVQEKGTRQVDVYLKSLRVTSLANAVVFTLLAVFAPSLINVFMDDVYSDSVLLVVILCVWGFCRSIGAPSASLAYANGRSDLDFKWNVGILPLNLIVIWFAANHGLITLAVILSLFQLLLTLASYFVYPKKLLSGVSYPGFIRQWASGFVLVTLASVLSLLVFEGDFFVKKWWFL